MRFDYLHQRIKKLRHLIEKREIRREFYKRYKEGLKKRREEFQEDENNPRIQFKSINENKYVAATVNDPASTYEQLALCSRILHETEATPIVPLRDLPRHLVVVQDYRCHVQRNGASSYRFQGCESVDLFIEILLCFFLFFMDNHFWFF